jgi:hypothetical protein
MKVMWGRWSACWTMYARGLCCGVATTRLPDGASPWGGGAVTTRMPYGGSPLEDGVVSVVRCSHDALARRCEPVGRWWPHATRWKPVVGGAGDGGLVVETGVTACVHFLIPRHHRVPTRVGDDRPRERRTPLSNRAPSPTTARGNRLRASHCKSRRRRLLLPSAGNRLRASHCKFKWSRRLRGSSVQTRQSPSKIALWKPPQDSAIISRTDHALRVKRSPASFGEPTRLNVLWNDQMQIAVRRTASWTHTLRPARQR